MKKIIGVGNALVDVITLIENDSLLAEFDLPKGSMTLVDADKSCFIKESTKQLKQILASGGSAANTIHGLAMLKANTGFIGSIGSDETGDFFEKDMKKAGVDTMLIRRNTPTGTAVALISPDSERTFATHLGAAIELCADDLKPELFKNYDILYLEGYLINDITLIEKACIEAMANNMEVALDLASFNVVNARLDDFKYIVNKYADIVFANEEEARSFTGLAPEEALDTLAGQCKIAVVKTGKEGSLIKRGDEKISISAMPVECRDTNGAGDHYAAGFIYGYANQLPLDKCGAIGTLLAGSVIEITGARIPAKMWGRLNKKVNSIVKEQ